MNAGFEEKAAVKMHCIFPIDSLPLLGAQFCRFDPPQFRTPRRKSNALPAD